MSLVKSRAEAVEEAQLTTLSLPAVLPRQRAVAHQVGPTRLRSPRFSALRGPGLTMASRAVRRPSTASVSVAEEAEVRAKRASWVDTRAARPALRLAVTVVLLTSWARTSTSAEAAREVLIRSMAPVPISIVADLEAAAVPMPTPMMPAMRTRVPMAMAEAARVVGCAVSARLSSDVPAEVVRSSSATPTRPRATLRSWAA